MRKARRPPRPRCQSLHQLYPIISFDSLATVVLTHLGTACQQHRPCRRQVSCLLASARQLVIVSIVFSLVGTEDSSYRIVRYHLQRTRRQWQFQMEKEVSPVLITNG